MTKRCPPTAIALALLAGCATVPLPTVALHEAATTGNVGQVRAHAHWGTDLEQRVDGETALHVAAREDRATVVATLLDAGAAQRASAWGATPLHLAAERDSVRVAKLLIERDGALEALDRAGRTPLDIAAEFDALGVATVLVAAGARVDGAHGDTTILIRAARDHAAGAVHDLLIDAGADIDKLLAADLGAGPLNEIAWRMVRRPDLPAHLRDDAVELAAAAADRLPNDRGTLNTFGVALYRAGRWAEAIAALRRCLTLPDGAGLEGTDRVFLAMAQAGAGDMAAARAEHARALAWFARRGIDAAERRFLSEAAEVVR